MRIINESDYALRIIAVLAESEGVVNAQQIAQKTDVSARFVLKILHKLCVSGITESRKGARGGYCLNKDPASISIGEIIESIEGPISICSCVKMDYKCPRLEEGGCYFHQFFCDFNRRIREELYQTDMASLAGSLSSGQV